MEVSMPDNTLFRKVLFGGYHKGDVLSYIENLEAEKESLKFSLQEAETKEPELPPELKAEYESTIAQLQEQVASLKKSSENGSDQLRALREETLSGGFDPHPAKPGHGNPQAISGTGFDASASGTGAGGAFNGPGNTDQTTKRSARGSVCADQTAAHSARSSVCTDRNPAV